MGAKPDNTVAKGYVIDEALKTIRQARDMLRAAGADAHTKETIGLITAGQIVTAVRETARLIAPELREFDVARALLTAARLVLDDAQRVEGATGRDAVHEATIDVLTDPSALKKRGGGA